MNYKNTYLVTIQYLGFRFHGWQKQPNLKTGHLFLDKTLKFIFKGIRLKSLGVGRTDARVSATHFAFQLFIDQTVDFEQFMIDFNANAPGDMRALKIEDIDKKFNIIQHPKIKEYRYYFSYGEKNHPYAAPFLTRFRDQLDLEIMKEGAQLFEGFHNFKRYCTKPSEETKVERTIEYCRIEKNTELTASFFPKESFVLIVRGEGFLRNQIRLIMGGLHSLGKGEYGLDFIKDSLNPESDIEFIKNIAPASGLHLHKLEFKDLD
ncbi:tRNA pseudouridine(38-40) synthase TruA [Tenacibaculum finnmarkense]|uniref:tRNA pseudouridine(38-40) synthase TruA n=1 Tax=Tenacibaculum finnmarkense TaxID=2781243 RepID=UPI001EFBB150|nr:tRNA pseudouridine(38-40) synthase TruA [Tenacibaculum finnmarkense]MCG8808363.1 tRNA pseudouridine(38-40) synthase TruA [Tenacibaculum finnmarkense]MCG8818593.1 tRNA pseudouridine(38-40) synthase TruA [Tenacibaculum finnmarkense]